MAAIWTALPVRERRPCPVSCCPVAGAPSAGLVRRSFDVGLAHSLLCFASLPHAKAMFAFHRSADGICRNLFVKERRMKPVVRNNGETKTGTNPQPNDVKDDAKEKKGAVDSK